MFKNKTPEFWLIMALAAIIIMCVSMCSTSPADPRTPAIRVWIVK